jgi:hypothetical protein
MVIEVQSINLEKSNTERKNIGFVSLGFPGALVNLEHALTQDPDVAQQSTRHAHLARSHRPGYQNAT